MFIMKSDISFKLKTIFNLCDAYIRKNLKQLATVQCSIILTTATMLNGKIPADVVLGDETNPTGTLPLWPMLWSKPDVFFHCTMILMCRQNNGREFDRSHLRTVKVETEQEFEAVLYEVLF